MRPVRTLVAPVRSLVTWCDDWPVVAAGAAADAPAAVVFANRVIACSPAARTDGVAVGLRRREAQGRCPALEVIEADPARDARAFEPVAAALEALTPRVEITRPGAVVFATRGPSRYFGGDHALAGKAQAIVTGALGGRGTCRVGIADGPFAAMLAARSAVETLVVPPGESARFLAPLPVDVLERPELADLLFRLGLTTLGAFAAVAPADVVGRFGADGEAAHRLARGLDERPPDARPVPSDLVVQAELDPPAERVDRAAFVAKTLAEELHTRLAAMGLGCTRLVIEAQTEHGEHLARVWRHEGALSAGAIAERVRWQLDGWLSGSAAAASVAERRNRPTAGISLLRLVPDEVTADRGRQLGFWGGAAEADERAGRALARVQGLLGPEAVTVPELRGGRSPAEQVALVPAGAVELSAERTVEGERAAEPWPGRLPAPSPATVHRHPPRAEVVDAAGAPVGVSGRGLVSAPPKSLSVDGNRWTDVVAWAGPWPLDERWWDPAAARRRARFQVVTADGRAHLLNLEHGHWTLEATYD